MEDSGSSPSGVTGEPVDISGLSFTATYSDGTTGSVVPSSYTPTSFGDTAGTQTVTFSFAGTDITVDVDYDVEEAVPTIVGLRLMEYTGTQTVGEPVDYSGMHFYLDLADGTTGDIGGEYIVDGAFNFASSGLSNDEWTAEGTYSLTATINDQSEFWSEMGVAIASPAPSCTFNVTVSEAATLDSLSVSGSFTNTQYTGSAPDLTGLTFTATYDDQSTKTVSASDIVCTPLAWDASGNPNNLGTQNVVFTYTEDGNSVSTGINGTVIHRPDTQTLDVNQAGVAYYDFDADHWISGSTPPLSPGELLNSGGNEDAWAVGIFPEAAWSNDQTVVDMTALGGAAIPYGIYIGDHSGTPNTPGYQPAFVNYDPQYSLNAQSIAVPVTGQDVTATEDTVLYIAVAPLSTSVSAGGYKKANFDLEANYARVYITTLTV